MFNTRVNWLRVNCLQYDFAIPMEVNFLFSLNTSILFEKWTVSLAHCIMWHQSRFIVRYVLLIYRCPVTAPYAAKQWPLEHTTIYFFSFFLIGTFRKAWSLNRTGIHNRLGFVNRSLMTLIKFFWPESSLYIPSIIQTPAHCLYGYNAKRFNSICTCVE